MQIIHGDCLERLKGLPDNSVDSIVTDPPYGISFMGKRWDYDVPSVEVWKECLRVLKPGGHALIACGTRTQHRMAVNIEDAGFEVRDVITWHYGSGFPKSMDISKAIDKAAGAEREIIEERFKNGDMKGVNGLKKIQAGQRSECNITAPATTSAKQWQGWGTALKPATEFWTLARKPISEKTVAANVQKWGTGAINVDGCRVEGEQGPDRSLGKPRRDDNDKYGKSNTHINPQSPLGRWPANLILDEEAAELLDEQSGVLTSGAISSSHKRHTAGGNGNTHGKMKGVTGPISDKNSGGASRFFYVAKASRSERNKGCDRTITWEGQDQNLQALAGELDQLLRGISAATIRRLEDFEWSTSSFGNPITDQCLEGFKYTISTVTSLTTGLKTLSSLAPLITKESIRAAIETIEANGLSLVESAELINRYRLTTTDAKTASALGASLAVFQTLSKIRSCAKLGNIHSTVKPIKLMTYLCRLITPPGGTVLDPFMGSGSTGVAAKQEGFGFIGIEREEQYVEIAKRRINA